MEGLNQECVLYVLEYYIYTSSKKSKVISRRLVPLNSYIDYLTLLNSVSEGFLHLGHLEILGLLNR